jgi:hypothetical protein
MHHGWRTLTAAVMVSLLLAGCGHVGHRDLLAVGTCVISDDKGTTPVACSEAHTHKLIAIAPKPEDCPTETDMAAQPADPDRGTTTECFRSDTAPK